LLNELGWRSEAIERQMAHGVSDSVPFKCIAVCGGMMIVRRYPRAGMIETGH